MKSLTHFAYGALALSIAFAASGCSADSTTSSATVSAIAVSPNPCAVGHTDSIQMSALATLPDGTKKDITSDATWATNNSNTATVSDKGTVVGVNAGVTSISASYQGAEGKVDCTVGL
ncbi:MAG: Ig-like domain-containing protein [Polyangiaceae bacterium]